MKGTHMDTNYCYAGRCDKQGNGHSKEGRGTRTGGWGGGRPPEDAQQSPGQKKIALRRRKTSLHRAEGRNSLWCSQRAQRDNIGREGKDDRRRAEGPLQEVYSTVEGIYLLQSLQNTLAGRVHIRLMSHQIISEINWRQKAECKAPSSAEKCWGLKKIAVRWEEGENRSRWHPRGNASRSWWQAVNGTQASSHGQEDPWVSCDNQIFPATKWPLSGCEAIWQFPVHSSFHFQMESMNQQKLLLTYIRS